VLKDSHEVPRPLLTERTTLDLAWEVLPGALASVGGSERLFWGLFCKDSSRDTFWLDRSALHDLLPAPIQSCRVHQEWFAPWCRGGDATSALQCWHKVLCFLPLSKVLFLAWSLLWYGSKSMGLHVMAETEHSLYQLGVSFFCLPNFSEHVCAVRVFQ
jgi:hypothetical protein